LTTEAGRGGGKNANLTVKGRNKRANGRWGINSRGPSSRRRKAAGAKKKMHRSTTRLTPGIKKEARKEDPGIVSIRRGGTLEWIIKRILTKGRNQATHEKRKRPHVAEEQGKKRGEAAEKGLHSERKEGGESVGLWGTQTRQERGIGEEWQEWESLVVVKKG